MAKSRRPSKATLVEIQNNTNSRQSVFDTDGDAGKEGMRHDIEPFDVKTVPKKLADLFLQRRAAYVSLYAPAETPRKEGEPLVWVANATGSPFVPDKVMAERTVKGEKTMIEVDNPLKKAVPIRRTMHGGFDIIASTDGDGKMTWPRPNLVFDFPPMRRVAISVSYANWNLERDLRQVEHHQGKLRQCSKPRDFEPNDSWSMTMLQCYAEQLGVDQFRNHPEVLGRDEEDYSHPDELEQDKSRLLRALYFVLLDDIDAPTESDVDAYLENFEARKRIRRVEEAKRKKASAIEAVAEAGKVVAKEKEAGT